MLNLIIPSIFFFCCYWCSDNYLNFDALENGDGSKESPFNEFSTAFEHILSKDKPIIENLTLVGDPRKSSRKNLFLLDGDVELNIYALTSFNFEIFPQITIANGAKFYISDLTLIQMDLADQIESQITIMNGGCLSIKRVILSNLKGPWNSFISCSQGAFIEMTNILINNAQTPFENSFIDLRSCKSVRLENITFKNNSLKSGSSFVASENSSLLITNVSLIQNSHALSSLFISPESFFLKLKTIKSANLSSFIIANNEIRNNGAIILLSDSSELSLNKVIAEENLIPFGAAIIKIFEISSVYIRDCFINFNTAYMGLFIQTSAFLKIENLICQANNYGSLGYCRSDFGGPCITLSRNLYVNISASTFNYLCGSSIPASILIFGTQANHQFYLGKSNFTKNFAIYNNKRPDIIAKGVNLYVGSPLNLTVSKCLFQDNFVSATENFVKAASSVVLVSENEESVIKIIGCQFIRNQALYKSNCITVRGALFVVEDSVIESNQQFDASISITSGGFISAYVDVLKLSNLLIRNNFAELYIFFQKIPISSTKFILIIVSFVGTKLSLTGFIFNSAEKGGVFGGGFVSNTFYFQAVDCIFTNNQATNEGGVGFFGHIGGNYTFVNCSFSNNFAFKGGVFIYVGTIDAPVILTRCSFTSNHAKQRGGVAAISSGTIKDRGSIYINNSAEGEGGLYVLENNALVHLSNCSIINSSAGLVAGVAILMEENIFIVDENTYLWGSISRKGACIAAKTLSKVNISGVTFLENIAYKGVILYLSNCVFASLVKSVTLESNWAMSEGLFLVEDSKLEISLLSLKGNSGNGISILSSIVNVTGLTSIHQLCKPEIKTCGCMICIRGNTILNILDFKILSATILGTGSLISMNGGSVSLDNCMISSVSVRNRSPIFSAFYSVFKMGNSVISDTGSAGLWLKASNSTFDNITYSGDATVPNVSFIESVYCDEFIFKNSLVSNTFINGYGGIIKFIGKTSNRPGKGKVVIADTVFFNNCAVQGGAIYVLNQGLEVYNTYFFENRAIEMGGAIFFFVSLDEYKENQYKWELKNNIFANNSAGLSGGAVYWHVFEPLNLASNEFTNNRAIHGKNFASEPYYLIPQDSSEINFTSGKASKQKIAVKIVDAYFQSIDYVDRGFGTLFLDQLNSKMEIEGVYGQLTSEVQRGRFEFSDITLIGTPNSNRTLNIKTDVVPRLNPYIKFISVDRGLLDNGLFNTDAKNTESNPKNFIHDEEGNTYTLKINVFVLPCMTGEIQNVITNTCDECSNGLYSVDPADSACFRCPAEIICFGGNNITLKRGFWRSSRNSFVFYKCDSKQDACIGGSSDELCKFGYTGPLCKSCIFDSKNKFIKGYNSQCVDCRELKTYFGFFVVIAVSLLVLAINIFLIKLALNSYNKAKHKLVNGRGNIKLEIQKAEEKNKISLYFRVLINHTQLMALVFSINIDWGVIFDQLENMSKSNSNFGTFLLPFDCWIGNLSYSLGYPFLQFRLLLMIAVFYIILLVVALLLAINKCAHKNVSFKSELIASFIITFFLFQPALINEFLSALKCITVDGKRYVAEETTIRCDDYNFIRYILLPVAPNLLLIMFLAPLILLIYMKRNVGNIYRTEKYFLCEFIVSGYKQKYFYWEFVIMIRKYSFIGATSFGGGNFASILSLFIFIILLNLIELKKQPFKDRLLNNICIFGNFVIFVCFSGAILLGAKLDQQVELFFLLLFYLANGLFFIFWLSSLFPRLKLFLRTITKKKSKAKILIIHKKQIKFGANGFFHKRNTSIKR